MLIKSKTIKPKKKVVNIISNELFDYKCSFNTFIEKKLTKDYEKYLFECDTFKTRNMILSEVCKEVNIWCLTNNLKTDQFSISILEVTNLKPKYGLFINLGETHVISIDPMTIEACDILSNYYIDKITKLAENQAKKNQKISSIVDELELLGKKVYSKILSDNILDITERIRKLI